MAHNKYALKREFIGLRFFFFAQYFRFFFEGTYFYLDLVAATPTYTGTLKICA